MPRPNTQPETIQDIHFPKAGVHVAGPFGRQPNRPVGRGKDQYVRTTADAENVRVYDPSGRDRGGSRSGLVKYNASHVNGETFVVQEINTCVSTGEPVQQSASGRVVYLVAVSHGVMKWMRPGDTTWTAPTNNTGDTPPLNASGPMQSTQNLQKLWFCDGTNYCVWNPKTNIIETWTATAGSLPRDDQNNGARLCCTWRGRNMLSGLLRDPQNIFATKVGEPQNFDYSPRPITKTDAFALNLSPLGLIGDTVTALIPYTDDVCIIGGDHTIYAMKGDPADGGSVDKISGITGIAFGKAWCEDPYGNVYFFGTKPSVWKMQGASQPMRISQPIEPELTDINTGTYLVTMVWNDADQGVHLWITYDVEPADTRHWFFDYRMQAWLPDRFANTDHNPLCTVAYDGNEPNDRAVLIGCWDGYVRSIDRDATTDDGTAITSYVLLGPILTQELDEMLLKEIQWVLGESSGDVTWEILAGDTAEAALAAAARASGTATAGRNGTQPIRVANHAMYIKISSTNRWAMETVRTVFAGRNKVRRRKP